MANQIQFRLHLWSPMAPHVWCESTYLYEPTGGKGKYEKNGLMLPKPLADCQMADLPLILETSPAGAREKVFRLPDGTNLDIPGMNDIWRESLVHSFKGQPSIRVFDPTDKTSLLQEEWHQHGYIEGSPEFSEQCADTAYPTQTGPAIRNFLENYSVWASKGLINRQDGPAKIYHNGDKEPEWVINAESLPKDEALLRMFGKSNLTQDLAENLLKSM